MWWLADFVGRVPFKVRLAIVLVAFAAMFLLAGPVIFRHTGLWFVLLFIIFFDVIVSRTERKPTYSAGILSEVRIKDGQLHVGDKTISTQKLNRVAIGQKNKQHGYLQFPFNPKFPVSYYFPADQVTPLRRYFAEQLPDVTVVD